MDPSLQLLIDRLNKLDEQFQEVRDGIRKAIDGADVDPEMALIRSRKVLEYVVRDVFVRRIQEPPGTRPLENLIQRLVKDGRFSPRLEAYTETIRKLGNVRAHHFGDRVSAADVYQSLTQLMPILEWYFEVERPEAGVHLNLPYAAAATTPVAPSSVKEAKVSLKGNADSRNSPDTTSMPPHDSTIRSIEPHWSPSPPTPELTNSLDITSVRMARTASSRFDGDKPLASKRPEAQGGRGIAGIAGLFGIVVYIATDNGTVKITGTDSHMKIAIDGDDVRIENLGTPITFHTGVHQLAVKHDGLEFKSESFQVRRGEETVLDVTYTPRVKEADRNKLEPRKPADSPPPRTVENPPASVTDTGKKASATPQPEYLTTRSRADQAQADSGGQLPDGLACR